jgi:hypothetical protein
MRKLVVFDHITLDGYFSGPNGDMSFFHNRFRDDEFHAFAVDNIKEARTASCSAEPLTSSWSIIGQRPKLSRMNPSLPNA